MLNKNNNSTLHQIHSQKCLLGPDWTKITIIVQSPALLQTLHVQVIIFLSFLLFFPLISLYADQVSDLAEVWFHVPAAWPSKEAEAQLPCPSSLSCHLSWASSDIPLSGQGVDLI